MKLEHRYLIEFNKLKRQVDKNDLGEAILFVVPASAGDVFLSTSLLPSIKQLFPDKNIYFSTSRQFFDILKNNTYIHKVIEYNKFHFTNVGDLSSAHIIEGACNIPGIFSVVYMPCSILQFSWCVFQHNGHRTSNLEFKNAN